MKPLILITCRQMQVELALHVARIEALGYDVIAPVLAGQQFSASELVTMSQGRLVGIIAGDDELSREFIAGTAETLKVIIRWGVGMDSVDHEAAREFGVVVRNTPGVFGREVADSAFTFLLMLARSHHLIDAQVRARGWPKVEGITLADAQLGVVGLGAIGREVAARGLGFGMSVVGYDPFVVAGSEPIGVSVSTLDDVLESSHFVVLTCPYTPETHHLINQSALSRMRSDAFLINVARGPIVDEVALAAALASHSIAGAGLDVFEVEPLPDESPLRNFDNVILGSHNGSNTRGGVSRASAMAVDFLVEELSAL